MPENTKEQQLFEKTQAYVTAYNERKRLFEQLSNPNFEEGEHEQLVKDYSAAAKDFDKQRTEFLKN